MDNHAQLYSAAILKLVTKNLAAQKIATQISTTNLGKAVKGGYEFTHLCAEH
jgi:hypothetical protein